MTDATYLVFMATGRQGGATVRALTSLGVTSIVCTSRNPSSEASQALLNSSDSVKEILQADLTDPASVAKAIEDSKATRIWFTTDYYNLKKPSRENEFLTGKAVVDGIVKCGSDRIEHVVYSSVGNADACSKKVQHFWSKADVEKYLAKELGDTTTTWSVIRPVAYYDNMDDAGNYNPLTKGKVKFLTKKQYRVKFVAVEDIGKGSARLLVDGPKGEYVGKIVDAAGGEHDGEELARALTEASGTKCTFATALPRFALWLLMRDLYHMVTWFESDGYDADIAAFKKLVPDAMDAKAWFAFKGKWADGEAFASTK